MRHSLLHTLRNAVWVAKAERRRPLPLLATYARLDVTELVSARGRDAGARQGTILGRPILVHDYYWLHGYRKAAPPAPVTR